MYITLILLLIELLGIAFTFDIRYIMTQTHLELLTVFGPEPLFRFFLLLGATIVLLDLRDKTIFFTLKRANIQFKPLWCSLHCFALILFIVLSIKLDDRESLLLTVQQRSIYTAIWYGLGAVIAPLLLVSVASYVRWWQGLKQIKKTLIASVGISALIYSVSLFTQSLWREFSGLTFQLVEFVLRYFYPEILVDKPSLVIGMPIFLVEIKPECSGFEGIGLVIVFLVCYLWINRQSFRFPHAYALLPMAIICIWILNVLRIATLVAIGISFSPDVAMHGFHSQAGWLAFLLVAFLLLWLAPKYFGIEEHHFAQNNAKLESHVALAEALLVPLILLMMVQMITVAVSVEADLLYPIKIILTGIALWFYRAQYRAIMGKLSWYGIVIGALVFVMWWWLEYLVADNTNQPPIWLTEFSDEYVAIWYTFRIMGSILIIPLAEELFFRGYLIRKLVSVNFEPVNPRHITLLSWGVSSVIFGLLHQRWLAGTIAGLGFAYAQYVRGSLLDAVAAHITANLLIAIMVLGFGQWSFWN